ncbi:MAG: FtsX-like permease family protein [Eubacteriales bacterium]|nr:FtsX-like permease family protein [Eubacteriales bacterium]
MNSYLQLIPISARLHRRQNRMTILCILISVLLVTSIFSVAQMFLRAESGSLLEKHGSWHLCLEGISTHAAAEIALRSDVAAAGWSETFNSDAAQDWYIEGKKAALTGADSVYMTQLVNAVEEGSFPKDDREVMLSSNAKLALDVQTGDRVTLQTPQGSSVFTVSGFGSDDRSYYAGQTYLINVSMTRTAFAALMEQNDVSGIPSFYVRFQNASTAAEASAQLARRYGLSEESISENTAVMGLSGMSGRESVRNLYGIAAVLFILVLAAGVLMISGSLNSNVAQRTKFFGMLRCIGASRRQILRYVRLEALSWCRTAVPAGLLLGTVVSWGICAALRFGVGGEFSSMPVLSVSPVGLVSGACAGIVTVLLAAQSPARRASRISPMEAVCGSAQPAYSARRPLKLRFGKAERSLGAHHAVASKKNFVLITASFSLSIILFLCFSVGLDFARALLPSLRSWQPDLTLGGYANERVLNRDLLDEIGAVPGVSRVFGCSYMEHVPAVSSREGVDHVDLISYSDALLDAAADDVTQGDLSAIRGDSRQVVTVTDKENPLKPGDTVTVAGETLTVACAVSEGVFSGAYSVICSDETFERLTGEQDYSLIGVQLEKEADDETAAQIVALAADDVVFSDLRESNRQDRATYLASALVVYSFLAILALIALFNIINSVSMSVAARTKQYGVMRAVGMDDGQLVRMIASEAFTYAFSGLLIGCGAGLLLSRLLYVRLLTRYFGMPWKLPAALLGMIVIFDLAAAAAAVFAPARRILRTAVTEAVDGP